MAESDELSGTHGDNWCVCPTFFGPPDFVDEYVMRWLVIPGPPMSCTVVHQFASPRAPEEYAAYHQHPKSFSIHVCLAGRGRHYAEGHMTEILPGSIFFEAAGCVHMTVAEPGHSLLHVVIQYPHAGYEDETKLVPEAGTLDRWRDLEAFVNAFGPNGENYKRATAGLFKSERWLKYVTNRAK